MSTLDRQDGDGQQGLSNTADFVLNGSPKVKSEYIEPAEWADIIYGKIQRIGGSVKQLPFFRELGGGKIFSPWACSEDSKYKEWLEKDFILSPRDPHKGLRCLILVWFQGSSNWWHALCLRPQ